VASDPTDLASVLRHWGRSATGRFGRSRTPSVPKPPARALAWERQPMGATVDVDDAEALAAVLRPHPRAAEQ
jgi:hypothetical protein